MGSLSLTKCNPWGSQKGERKKQEKKMVGKNGENWLAELIRLSIKRDNRQQYIGCQTLLFIIFWVPCSKFVNRNT